MQVWLKDGTASGEPGGRGAEARESKQEHVVGQHGGHIKSLAAMAGEEQELAEDALLGDKEALASQSYSQSVV
jgi:hypothetical protein